MVEVSPFGNVSKFEKYPREKRQCEEKRDIPTESRDTLMTSRNICIFPLTEFERDPSRSLYSQGLNVYGDLDISCENRIRMISWYTDSTDKLEPNRTFSRKLKKFENEVVRAEFHYPRNIYTSMRSEYNNIQQRQPLLPLDNIHRQNPYSAYRKMGNIVGAAGIDQAVSVNMDIDRDYSPENFPKERKKTLMAFGIMASVMILSVLSLSLVHERLPNRDLVGPLSDIILDNVPAYDWALDVSEYTMMIYIVATVVVIVIHKHRYIVLRRVFLMMSVLYLYRAVTMYITVLPVSSKTYPCSPKSSHLTALEVMKRILQLMSGIGFSVNGQHTYCGDFIYSGHTVIIVLCHLILVEYTNLKFWVIHCICFVPTCLGVLMLLLSHGHYSVDVVIAYYITTRLFWLYHMLVNNIGLKQYSLTNYISREWWFRIFLYFEKNVGGIVPNEFEWPFPQLTSSWQFPWSRSSY